MKFHKDLIGLISIIVIVIIIGVTQVVNASNQAIIRNVVDGDTLKVFYEGQKESVRLIGIDTPQYGLGLLPGNGPLAKLRNRCLNYFVGSVARPSLVMSPPPTARRVSSIIRGRWGGSMCGKMITASGLEGTRAWKGSGSYQRACADCGVPLTQGKNRPLSKAVLRCTVSCDDSLCFQEWSQVM